MSREQQYTFQATLLRLMLSLEDSFVSLAKSSGERCVVLMDRGTMDCRSYMPEDEWERLAAEVGSSTLQLRDERYDCVVHLVTAADGAEKFYTTAGHATRWEAADYARELDARVKNNWIGHHHFHVIDNCGDGFNGKIRRVISTICQFVGLRGAVGMSKRKFLVRPSSIQYLPPPHADRIAFPDSVRYQRFEVDHDYILRPSAEGEEEQRTHQLRLRRRGVGGVFTYSYTLRYPDLHGQRLELKRIINRREYADLLSQRDPLTVTVKKQRYSFLWGDEYYELDQYIQPHPGLVLLEVYAEKHRDISAQLPNFIEIEKEVTGVKEYSMYTLARIHPSTGTATNSGNNSHSVSRNSGSGIAAFTNGTSSNGTLLEQLQRHNAFKGLHSGSATTSPAIAPVSAIQQPTEEAL